MKNHQTSHAKVYMMFQNVILMEQNGTNIKRLKKKKAKESTWEPSSKLHPLGQKSLQQILLTLPYDANYSYLMYVHIYSFPLYQSVFMYHELSWPKALQTFLLAYSNITYILFSLIIVITIYFWVIMLFALPVKLYCPGHKWTHGSLLFSECMAEVASMTVGAGNTSECTAWNYRGWKAEGLGRAWEWEGREAMRGRAAEAAMCEWEVGLSGLI